MHSLEKTLLQKKKKFNMYVCIGLPTMETFRLGTFVNQWKFMILVFILW